MRQDWLLRTCSAPTARVNANPRRDGWSSVTFSASGKSLNTKRGEIGEENRLTMAAIVLALLIGLICLWLHLRQRRRRKKKRYAPVVGFSLNLIFQFRRVHDYFTEHARRSKCFRILHPGRSYVVLADPRDLEYILSSNFSNFGKGSYNRDYLGDLLGDGIFTADGDIWRHQRKLASHEFSTRNLRDSSSQVFKNTAGKLAQVISMAASLNQTLDLQNLLMRSTMDSICQVAFGVALDTLGGGNEESEKFSKAFDDSSELVLWRYADPSWKIKKLLNVGGEAALRKNINVIDDFVYKIIEEKIELMSKDQGSSEIRKYDILSRFLEEREKVPDEISKKYLRDIILSFVIAGKDTTASVLSWFFYRMCIHPDIQRKVTEELVNATDANLLGSSSVEFAEKLRDVNSLPYLHATINETLRLHPGIPQDPKMCFSDDTLPSGFDVKAGDIIVYLPYSMGRLKDLWGEDAEDFRPERWLDEVGNIRHESPFKFPAFQAGPRVCLGKEFAYTQMKIFAAVLLHSFDFRLADDGKDIRYRTMLTLQILGFRVRAIPRQFKL